MRGLIEDNFFNKDKEINIYSKENEDNFFNKDNENNFYNFDNFFMDAFSGFTCNYYNNKV